MKKIFMMMLVLGTLFVLACSKDSIADQTVKVLEDAVAKIQKCENAEDLKAISLEVQEFLTANQEEIDKFDEQGPEAEKMQKAMAAFVSALAEKGGIGEFLDIAKSMAEKEKAEAAEEAVEEIADAAKEATDDIADAAKEAAKDVAEAMKE